MVPNKNKIKIKIGAKDEIGLGLVMMLVSQLLPTQSKPPQPHRFSHNTQVKEKKCQVMIHSKVVKTNGEA